MRENGARILMATLYIFSKLKNKKARERALEEFKDQYEYPDFDDVGQISDYLSEWLQNCLGISHDADKLYWKTYPTEVQINCHSYLDFDHLENTIAKPELNPEGNYDGETGTQIIARQKKVLAAYRTLIMVGKLASPPITIDFNCTIDDNKVEDAEASYYGECSIEDMEAIDHATERLEEYINDYMSFCARELERLLEEDIDWHHSEEHLKEVLEDNQYTEFNYKGEIA